MTLSKDREKYAKWRIRWLAADANFVSSTNPLPEEYPYDGRKGLIDGD
jgi:hypothetical protein